MQGSKVLAYLGFARKAGKLRTGVNAISTLKSANVLVVCESASENTVKDALKLARRFHCPLVSSAISVEEITGKENCKLLCVTDGNLAKAILNNLDGNFTLKSEAVRTDG